MTAKLTWQGRILAVQPRIRLYRSFDERSQTDLGYLLQIDGKVGEEERVFTVGIGPAAQTKHAFQVGDVAQGECLPPDERRSEPAELYKVSKLQLLARSPAEPSTPPPWMGTPPSLELYRERGFRRLATRAYDTVCAGCLWGCRMAVEIVVDHWNPSYAVTVAKPSATAPSPAPSTRLAPRAKCPVARA